MASTNPEDEGVYTTNLHSPNLSAYVQCFQIHDRAWYWFWFS